MKEKNTVPYKEMIGDMEVTVISDVNMGCENETQDLILDNLGVLLNNYDLIVNTPRFAGIKLPNPIFGMMYAGSGMGRCTLDRLLSIFKNEPNFNSTCPYCGGRACMIQSGGSPLSGIIYSAKYKCISDNCKKDLFFKHGWTYGEEIVKLKKDNACDIMYPPGDVLSLAKIIGKYKNSDCKEPADIEELLQLLSEKEI